MKSKIEDVVLHVAGWAPLMPGVEATRLPCFDRREELFARCDYHDSLEVARRLGGRLGTQAEHDELARVGILLRPVILPPTSEMTSRAWCERHDRGVWGQIGALVLDGTIAGDLAAMPPFANVGKQWVSGAAPGRAINYGWWDPGAPNGVMWQRMGRVHDDRHVDYSQLLTLFRNE